MSDSSGPGGFPGTPPPGGPYGTPGTPPPPPPLQVPGATGWNPAPGWNQPPPGFPPGPGMPYTMPVGAPVPRRTNGLAIASLVLGIVWLCGVGSLLAVVFGFVALGQIKRLGQGGRGLAIAGVVLGILGLLAVGGVVVVARYASDKVVTSHAHDADDLELTSCTRGDGGRVVADVAITNRSSKTSSYIFTLRVTDRSDSSIEESVPDRVSSITSHVTQHESVTTIGTNFTEPVCEITGVLRFAASTVGG